MGDQWPPHAASGSAGARPDTEPSTPIALAGSAGAGKVPAVIAIATGLSMVPPAACSVRAAISQPIPGARPHSSEPRPDAARPAMKTRRRPTRSAVEPARIRTLASTRVYASAVRSRPDTEARRSRRIAGSATLTIEMSITTTRMLAQHVASTRSRRRRLSPGMRVQSAGAAGVHRGRIAAGDADRLWAPGSAAATGR